MNKRFAQFLQDLAEENEKLERILKNEISRADSLYDSLKYEREKVRKLQAKVRELKQKQKEAK